MKDRNEECGEQVGPVLCWVATCLGGVSLLGCVTEVRGQSDWEPQRKDQDQEDRFLWDPCLTHQDVGQKKCQGEPVQGLQQVSLFPVCVCVCVLSQLTRVMFPALVLFGYTDCTRVIGPEVKLQTKVLSSFVGSACCGVCVCNVCVCPRTDQWCCWF